jgi:tetratricopeptide (TPR) repeat protein
VSDTTGMDINQALGQSHELKEALGGGGFGEFMEQNAKLLFAIFVVIMLGALGYVGYQFVQKHQERIAQDDLSPAEEKFNKMKDGFEQAKMQALMPGMAPKDDKTVQAKPATGNLEQDYGSVLTDLEKVARERAGTSAGAQAAILLADTYISYKQPEKAIEMAKIPAERLSSSNTLASLARVLWGTALADKGDCGQAVGVWQAVIDSKNDKFLHPDVGLRSGLCYEKLGQLDKAAEMYRKVSAEAGDSAAGQTAKGLLRALEMKMKTTPAAEAGKGGAA